MKINTKIIVYFLGFLLLINGGFMFLTALLSYIYQDGITNSLLISGVLVTLVGLAMLLLNKNHDKQINKREGYLVVVLGWLAMIFSGTIPYIFTGTIDGFSNIFFETTSGFTATGATIINDVEILPEGILFWRSITHWLGGMGMIVFAIAILPLLGIGGMQLFSAESPGPSTDKLHPRITDTAKRLWLIYVSYTLIETICLKLAGMSFFDAINHSMSNIASGGFSTKNESLAHWNSNPLIQYIVIFFMFECSRSRREHVGLGSSPRETLKSFWSTAPPGNTNLLGIKIADFPRWPNKTAGLGPSLLTIITLLASLISDFIILSYFYFL